ncbi:MAG: hypothetical protein ABIW38_02920 [Ferruginibacter sp.]
MHFLKTGLIIMIAVMLLQSCQKDVDSFTPSTGTGPDTTWVPLVTAAMPVNVLRERLRLDTQRDSTELVGINAITVTTNAGLKITFAANSFTTLAGTIATGRIRFETILLRKRGEFIRMGFPTVSNGNTMVSGGELFVSARKDSNELQLAPSRNINLHYEQPTIIQGLKIFNGVNFSAPQPFNWLFNQDTVNNKVYAVNNAYELIVNKLGWINPGKIPDTIGIQQTRLTPLLPSHYTNANSIVFVSYNNQLSVTIMEAIVSGRIFRSLPVPVGAQISVIVISKMGDDYFLGHSVVTSLQPTVINGLQQVQLNPVRTSLDNIKSYLNTL